MPAKAASHPRMRSSSMAWPTDSWIWRASCSLPRMRSTVPGTHSGAWRSSTASSPMRRALPAQVGLPDELVAAGAELPADAAEGAPLGLPLADRGGRHGHAALHQVLGDAVALAGDEPLLGVPRHEVGVGHGDALDVGHLVGDVDQQVALLGQGDLGRVLLPGRVPMGLVDGDVGQLEGRSRHHGRRPGDGGGLARRRRGPGRRTARARRRTPTTSPTRARTPTPADWARATCSRMPSVADRSSVVMIMARASAYVAPAASAASTAALATSNMARTLPARRTGAPARSSPVTLNRHILRVHRHQLRVSRRCRGWLGRRPGGRWGCGRASTTRSRGRPPRTGRSTRGRHRARRTRPA